MASSDGRTTSAQSNLRQQNLTGLDVTKLSALSPEVISRQATINIGTIGHVAHGKSTVVKAISGVQTVRFKNELERNITIKLERLSETVVRLFHERATEREEAMLYEKAFKRSKKRNLTPEPEDVPPAKKKKGNHQKKDEFIIEKIFDLKIQSGKEYFYVKWKDYSDDDNTWEPFEHLVNCPLVITEFTNSMEVKYCDALEKLKQEISFDNLLEEENLVDRLKESEEIDLTDVKRDMILKLLFILNLDESEEDCASQLVQDARDLLQLYTVSRKRCSQLVSLKKWEEHLNQVDRSKKLTVENNADFAGPPDDFKYINQSIPGLGVTIPDDPPIGCDCTACNCRTKTCCGTQGGYFPYTTKKRLRVASGTPIYECNKACKCSQDCCNRVVQHGRNIKLCIFRTANGRGWGVRAEQKIFQGQFICQYIGEIITFEETEKRGREYDANGLTYLFDLDFNSTDNPYTIDAANLGNVSHFINHSCEPNVGVWAVWADCLDPNLPTLAFFANCDIEAGEEICFDYLQKASDSDEGPSTSGSISGEVHGAGALEPAEPTDAATPVKDDGSPGKDASPTKSRFAQQQTDKTHRNRTECRCGTITCRKYLF